jgi:hypothetical protein
VVDTDGMTTDKRPEVARIFDIPLSMLGNSELVGCEQESIALKADFDEYLSGGTELAFVEDVSD